MESSYCPSASTLSFHLPATSRSPFSSISPKGSISRPPRPTPSHTHIQVHPQVNRAISPNSQSINTLPQIVRYTCGSLAFANVPQNALSPRCALLSLPQVNRAISHNSQSTNTLPQIAWYTCESLAAANVPQNALSPRCALLSLPQANRTISHNSQITNTLPQTARYTCENTTVDRQPGAGYTQCA